uniref:Uncharacterized protein n=1 Tax=Trichogramma kaykai TaxID=54128 RepID=A0ABD2W2A9_9HYME
MQRTNCRLALLPLAVILLLVLLLLEGTEAQYKYRRPPPQLIGGPPPPLPPPPQIYKKSWAPGPPRLGPGGGGLPPSMSGNSIHMGAPNFLHKRPPIFKPLNYRFRRPPGPPGSPMPPMFNVVPSAYKPMPASISGLLGGPTNFGSLLKQKQQQQQPQPQPLPQQQQQQQQQQPQVQQQQHQSVVQPSMQRVIGPMKELQSMAKLPQQYSPEYRPEMSMPLHHHHHHHHRAGVDDDRGPIHTIPAPNLGPASKSFQQQQQYQQQQREQQQQQQQQQESMKRPTYSVTQVDYSTVFNGQDANMESQRISPGGATSSVGQLVHQYEVTESNEINSATPATYFTPDFDSAAQYAAVLQEQQLQANDVYANHPSSSLSRSSQQQQQQQDSDADSSASMNLHSTMHVGGVSSSGSSSGDSQSSGQQDLHVGQPVAGGPTISATKLYEVLNAFPQQLTDQYALSQQPQIQQHLLQQQLTQILQQQQQSLQDDTDAKQTSFSQPILHSFNYDEQADKPKQQRKQQSQSQQQQQQQSIFVNQNYASGRVSADYSLSPDASDVQEVGVIGVGAADAGAQPENNIDYEKAAAANFLEDKGLTSQFYTTLPNRDAAETLAALAAAGNVNSQLIGQLRKQQQEQRQRLREQQQNNQQSSSSSSASSSMPSNHKDENDKEQQQQQQQHEVASEKQSSNTQKQLEHRRKLFYRRNKNRSDTPLSDEGKKEDTKDDEKLSLRIMVSDESEEKDNSEEYEYERDEADNSRNNESPTEETEFGSRIA